MAQDRTSDVQYVSLVDRLKSTATSSPKVRLNLKDKENVDSSSSSASLNRTAVARSPSLFIPSTPAAFDSARAKGKAKEDVLASSKAASKRSTPLAKTVITFDSTSSFSVSDDDDFPVFISGHIPSSGSDKNGSNPERAGMSDKLNTSRSFFKPPLSTSSSTSRSAAKDTSSAFFSPAGARLRLPNNLDGSSSSRSSTPKKSAPRTSSSSADIIEIIDSSNSFHTSTPSSRTVAGAKKPLGQASSGVPPSSADGFWDKLSASELELLETGPAGPSRSPRPAMSNHVEQTRTTHSKQPQTMSITIEDDDDDDILEEEYDDDIQDADGPFPFEEEPPPGFDHDPDDEDMERAFLNFEDDDDSMYTMLEEQALASRARTAAASSSSSTGPVAPRLGSDEFERVPLQHTPLSALPEDVRRRFLEQFGKPDDEERGTSRQRSDRGGGSRNSRYNLGGNFRDDDWNPEDDEDEEQQEGFISPSRRERGASSSRGKARGSYSRKASYARKARAGWRRGSGSRGGRS